VADSAELTEHHRIRHAVFVVEQGLFEGSDVDAQDADESTLHLVGFVAGVAAGTVRLWPRPDGSWQGDRLAVLPGYRHVGLGGPLVRLAVRTAAELGGSVMTAHVQVANVNFFRSLGWSNDGPAGDYLGQSHQPMTIALR
jgi:putative N-acetyltransferase (TIGR04045 family)